MGEAEILVHRKVSWVYSVHKLETNYWVLKFCGDSGRNGDGKGVFILVWLMKRLLGFSNGERWYSLGYFTSVEWEFGVLDCLCYNS